LSAFGFALAARPLRAARELVRVCRPGGVVALAAWCPGGPFEQHAWGHAPRARDRLEPLLDQLEVWSPDPRYVLIRGVRRPTRPGRPTS
jgi:SAM-dependent methyltransferase